MASYNKSHKNVRYVKLHVADYSKSGTLDYTPSHTVQSVDVTTLYAHSILQQVIK